MPFLERGANGYSQEPLLPKTKSETRLSEAGSLGKFAGSPNGLIEISDAIEDRRVHKADDFHSIPDFFAILGLFDAVCRNKEHTLHKSMIEQWRGLLTIVLLHSELNMLVKPVDFDLNGLSSNSSIIFHTARVYLPKDYGNKIRVYLCRAEDGTMTPIALQTPKAFLCPANGIKKKLHNAPGFISDATERSVVVNGAISFVDVAGFLKKNPHYGITMLKKLETVKDVSLSPIKELLQDFIDAIGINNPDVYESMETGETLIPELISHFHPEKPFVLNESGWSRESIFTKKLCIFPHSELNEGCYSKQEIAGFTCDASTCFAMLPLKKEFISAYIKDSRVNSANDIDSCLTSLAGSVKLTYLNGEKVHAELKVLDKIFQYDYYKTDYVNCYDNGGEDKFLTASPITIWPNKADPNGKWKSYFLFQSTSIGDTTGDRLKISVIDYKNGEAYQVNDYAQDGDKFYITKASNFPYILCGAFEGHDVGAFLVKPAGSLSEKREETAYMGIDFGTTNTIAYYSLRSEGRLTKPVAVKFQKAETILSVIGSIDQSAMIAKHFVPFDLLVENDGVFGSIWHILKQNAADTVNPLLHGNILFSDIEDSYKTTDRNTRATSLKWGETASSRRNANNFIAEYAMLCAWKCMNEQADKIHWRAAYPTAYKDFEGYHDAFMESVKTAVQSNGIEFIDGRNIYDESANSFIMTTENHAAGIGLAQNGCVNRGHGFISIDIGGGSTDISIWQKPRKTDGKDAIGIAQRAVVETSFRYAGNRILADSVFNLLKKNPDENCKIFFDNFLELNSDERHSIDKALSTSSSEGFYDAFNRILRRMPDKELKDKLRNHNGDGIVLELAKIVEFNLAVIITYAAYLLSEATTGGKYDMDDKSIDIVFGGNGSKLLNWARPGFEHTLENLFTSLGLAPSGINVNLKRSAIPKKEVAYGLVAEELLFSGDLNELRAQKPKDYVDEGRLFLTEKDGSSDASMIQASGKLLLIFDKFVERLYKDFSSNLEPFSGWKSNADNIMRDIRGRLEDLSIPNSSFNDGFVLALEKLNERFYNN